MPLVPVGNPHSNLFSPDETFVTDGSLVKIIAWHDNGWGFFKRAVEMLARMS